MDKSNNDKVDKMLHSVGLKYGIKDEDIRNIFESQFRFTYDTIRELDFTNLTKEEIEELKTNFQYKYIGKLYINKKTLKEWKEI